MGIAKNINAAVTREFQIFVKPAGPLCNLNCSYCYYLDKSILFSNAGITRMKEDLLGVYIRSHIQASTGPVIAFSWHGGEPLLAGKDFYRRAVALQKKWCPPGKRIINGIQTNGTLIDEEWCKFLAEENFMVGISLDGPEELHNTLRLEKDGSGTFRKVLHGFDLLVLHDVAPEILCVVHSGNSPYPLNVYRFFRQLGVTYISFIPLAEQHSGGGATEGSVDPEVWGEFLCTVFDEWLSKDIGKIKVQIIEEALRTAFNQEHTLCIFKPVCGGVPVVEYNGDFYSCDHFVNPEHWIGNLKSASVSELLDSEKQAVFGRAKRDTLPDQCLKCEVLSMCNGECPKNRFSFAQDGEPGLNYLCGGYRKFFNHCRPFIQKVSAVYRQC